MGRSRLLLAAAGWGVLALHGGLARGADKVTPATDAAARQAFERAEAAYQSGDLPGALREMEQSYQLSQRADLLYNLARLEDELEQCAAARAHYQQYVERVPQGEARAEAELADKRLAARCSVGAPPTPVTEPAVPPAAAPPAAEAPAAEPPVVFPVQAPPPAAAPPERGPTPAASPNHGSTQRWLGWSLIGGGVVAGLGGLYFLDSALDSRAAYQASVDREEAGGPIHDKRLQDDQDRHQRTARVLGLSSAALLIGGAVVVLLAPSESSGGQRAAVHLQPGLFAATYGRSF